MKLVTRKVGQPESLECQALRQTLATPGFADSVTAIHYIDTNGERTTFQHARAEEFELSVAGSVKHDEILATLRGEETA